MCGPVIGEGPLEIPQSTELLDFYPRTIVLDMEYNHLETHLSLNRFARVIFVTRTFCPLQTRLLELLGHCSLPFPGKTHIVRQTVHRTLVPTLPLILLLISC